MSGQKEDRRREWVIWYCAVGCFGLGILGWLVAGFGWTVLDPLEREPAILLGFLLAGVGWIGAGGLGTLLSGNLEKGVGFGTFGVGNFLVAAAMGAPSTLLQVVAGTLAVVAVLAGWLVVKSETVPVVDV